MEKENAHMRKTKNEWGGGWLIKRKTCAVHNTRSLKGREWCATCRGCSRGRAGRKLARGEGSRAGDGCTGNLQRMRFATVTRNQKNQYTETGYGDWVVAWQQEGSVAARERQRERGRAAGQRAGSIPHNSADKGAHRCCCCCCGCF